MKRKRERERERTVSLELCRKTIQYPCTGLVLLTKEQNILSRSWKPGRESELGRFPCSNENGDRKKDVGDPGLSWSKGILLAEMQAYISLVKWLLSHYKGWNSISCNKMGSLIHTRSLMLKKVTACLILWPQSWELRVALFVLGIGTDNEQRTLEK